MGTSTRYKWSHGRHIEKPILKAAPDSRKLSKTISDSADKLCKSMKQTRWRSGITDPIVASAAGATARACHSIGEIMDGDRRWPSTDVELADFVSRTCDGMDGIHDAPVRRAIVRTIDQLELDVQAQEAKGLPLDNDLFCLFYQVLHTELLTELLLHFTCETALPGVSTIVLQTELGKWAIERVAKFLPNPCKAPNPHNLRMPVRGGQLAVDAIKNLIEGRETTSETYE